MLPEERCFDPVLVTGALGFVGACVVRELVARRQEVHLLLRRDSQTWRLDDVRDQVTAHRASLVDAEATRAVVLDVRPRAVLHLATHGAYESQADARVILQTNILGTYNLLAASAESGVKVFVNAGSSSEYGFKAQPMKETDRLEPNSFYAVSKAAQTHLCSLLAGQTRHGGRHLPALLGVRPVGGADSARADDPPPRPGRAAAGDGLPGDGAGLRVRR